MQLDEDQVAGFAGQEARPGTVGAGRLGHVPSLDLPSTAIPLSFVRSSPHPFPAAYLTLSLDNAHPFSPSQRIITNVSRLVTVNRSRVMGLCGMMSWTSASPLHQPPADLRLSLFALLCLADDNVHTQQQRHTQRTRSWKTLRDIMMLPVRWCCRRRSVR